METLKEKITGFRFIVYVITVLFTAGYIVLCKYTPGLIPLQGVITFIISLSGGLIAGKTITDIKGKKL